MHEWYKAVCDNHGEMIDLFVDNPTNTAHYLAENDVAMQIWLTLHWKCNLRLIHRDDELDACFDDQVEKVRF